MRGAARLAQATAGPACDWRQAALWGKFYAANTQGREEKACEGLPETDPNPSQSVEPKIGGRQRWLSRGGCERSLLRVG